MRLIFAGKSARDATFPALTSERLVNLYAVPAPDGARAALMLRNVLGTRDFATLPGPFLRALGNCGGRIVAVSRGVVSAIAASGSVALLGAVSDDAQTSLVDAGAGKIAVCAGGAYHLWDGTSLTQPGGGRLTSIGSVAYSNSYLLMAQAGGTEIEWSAAGDPASRNALYFAKAAARGDRIVRLVAIGPYVWAMKERSIEVWALAGTGPGAWAPIPGAVYEVGLRDFRLCAAMPEGMFFVGHDNVAYLATGGKPLAISTPPVAQALLDEAPTNCFYYADRGHRFCVIRFDGRPALCFDLDTALWHERAEGVGHTSWQAVASVDCYGQWHVGGRLGRLWRLGQTPVDASGVMVRRAVSRTLEPDNRFTVARFEIFGSFGTAEIDENAPAWLLDEFGLPVTDSAGRPIHMEGPDPVTAWRRAPAGWLRFSRDGGLTWGAQKYRSFGRVGAYGTRCSLRAMGQFRTMTAEFSMSDPVVMPIFAEASIE